METSPTVEITIGTVFYDDHVARDLIAGTEVSRTSSRVTVALASWDYDELLSDAEFYAQESAAYEDASLISAAKRLTKRLREIDRPAGPNQPPTGEG